MAVATEMGVEFEEIRYTKNPPDEAALRDLIAKLEDPVENLVRKDAQFKSSNSSRTTTSATPTRSSRSCLPTRSFCSDR